MTDSRTTDVTAPAAALSSARSRRMQEAARELVVRLEETRDDGLLASFEDADYRCWSYVPGERAGLFLPDVPAVDQDVLWDLVAASSGSVGADLVASAMEVERYRRMKAGGEPVGDDRYWLRVYGDPGKGADAGKDAEPGEAGVWGWRLNGHHIAVHVVAHGADMTITPHFIGSEPAEVPTGPLAGRRILGVEEDLARALVSTLDDAHWQEAVVADEPPDDILTRNDPVVDPAQVPAGLSYGHMTAVQQVMCALLVRRHFDRAPVDYATRCWDEAAEAPDEISFAWAGGTQRGDRHYFCLRGPSFVIEYDNTQDGGNHAHSVWRQVRDDFGGDRLRRHYRERHADR